MYMFSKGCLFIFIVYIAVYNRPKLTTGPEDVSAKISQDVRFTCEFEASTQPGVSIVVWLKDDFAVLHSSSHYTISNTPVTGSSINENTDHFISTLSISSVTDDDEGKYSCYCYYNKTIVTSTKQEYIRSTPKSANLNINSDNNKSWSNVKLYASISAGTAVFVSVITIWIIGVSFYLRYRRRPRLVDLNEDCYDSTDNEKQPLLDKSKYEVIYNF